MRDIDTVIVHCSATDWGDDIGVDEIRAWHTGKGWRDIGYHYVIKINGDIQHGRPVDQAGAHVKGFNASSIGICLVGGRDGTANYTAAQWDSLRMLCDHLASKYAAIVTGHNEYTDQKTCPNFKASEWWLNE